MLQLSHYNTEERLEAAAANVAFACSDESNSVTGIQIILKIQSISDLHANTPTIVAGDMDPFGS